MKYIIPFLFLLLIACNQNPSPNRDRPEENKRYQVSDSEAQNSNLKNDIEGYWISLPNKFVLKISTIKPGVGFWFSSYLAKLHTIRAKIRIIMNE